LPPLTGAYFLKAVVESLVCSNSADDNDVDINRQSVPRRPSAYFGREIVSNASSGGGFWLYICRRLVDAVWAHSRTDELTTQIL
jgi:hypothetical protein